MPSLQVKEVPEEVLDVLKRRAAMSHRSLQQYLLDHLIEEASRPTLDEVLDRASGRAGGSMPFEQAVATTREDRARR